MLGMVSRIQAQDVQVYYSGPYDAEAGEFDHRAIAHCTTLQFSLHPSSTRALLLSLKRRHAKAGVDTPRWGNELCGAFS